MDSPSNDFRSLQALLRLKRYEQPPPRYFNEFSSNVIASIRAGEIRPRRSWWDVFGFDIRPAITFGAASIACGLLLATVGFGFENDAAQAGLVAGAAFAAAAPAENAAVTDVFAPVDAKGPVSTEPVMNASADTNTTSDLARIFRTSPWRGHVQSVSFSPGRN